MSGEVITCPFDKTECIYMNCIMFAPAYDRCGFVMMKNAILQGAKVQEPPKRTSRTIVRPDGLPSVTRLEWLIKGGEEASPTAPFAFAYVHGYDSAARKPTSDIKEDSRELYNYIKEKGPFELDGFKYSISKGDVFLNRNKAD